MSKKLLSLSALLFAIALATAPLVEARVGGGRSSGSRGARGFTSRSYSQQQQNRGGFQQQQQSSFGQNGQQQRPSMFGGGGGFMRNMAAGIAGGFLGSLLFRSLGHAGSPFGGAGGGGIGFLEILLIGGLAFMAYRFFKRRQQASSGLNPGNMNAYERVQNLRGTGPYASQAPFANEAMNEEREEDLAERLRSSNPTFSLDRFKDERMDDFLAIQSAWNERDLSRAHSLIAPEILREFESDVSSLKSSGRINRLENIAVRGTRLVEAWNEPGKEYATLQFRAHLLDYTIDENTQQLVSGDKSQPVKFEEEWTFVRSANSGVIGQPWQLTAISQV